MSRVLPILLALLLIPGSGLAPLESADPPSYRKPIVRSNDEASATPVPVVPAIAILSPKETVAGKLVKLDASKSTVESLEWRLVDGPQEDFSVEADGKRATFATPVSGVYFVAVAGATVVNGKAVATSAVVKVTLIDDPDKPATPPVAPPPVAPPPVVPPSTPTTPAPAPVSMATWVLGSVLRNVEMGQDRIRVAQALSKSYRLWADGAGKLTTDPQQFVVGSNRLVDLLLQQTGKQAEWKPFRDELQTKLGTMGLTTVPQHIEVWKQIADGLEKVIQ